MMEIGWERKRWRDRSGVRETIESLTQKLRNLQKERDLCLYRYKCLTVCILWLLTVVQRRRTRLDESPSWQRTAAVCEKQPKTRRRCQTVRHILNRVPVHLCSTKSVPEAKCGTASVTARQTDVQPKSKLLCERRRYKARIKCRHILTPNKTQRQWRWLTLRPLKQHKCHTVIISASPKLLWSNYWWERDVWKAKREIFVTKIMWQLDIITFTKDGFIRPRCT